MQCARKLCSQHKTWLHTKNVRNTNLFVLITIATPSFFDLFPPGAAMAWSGLSTEATGTLARALESVRDDQLKDQAIAVLKTLNLQ